MGYQPSLILDVVLNFLFLIRLLQNEQSIPNGDILLFFIVSSEKHNKQNQPTYTKPLTWHLFTTCHTPSHCNEWHCSSWRDGWMDVRPNREHRRNDSEIWKRLQSPFSPGDWQHNFLSSLGGVCWLGRSCTTDDGMSVGLYAKVLFAATNNVLFALCLVDFFPVLCCGARCPIPYTNEAPTVVGNFCPYIYKPPLGCHDKERNFRFSRCLARGGDLTVGWDF